MSSARSFGGDEVEVRLDVDDAPRVITVPKDLAELNAGRRRLSAASPERRGLGPGSGSGQPRLARPAFISALSK
jgi:hypothetical protein